jgi:hypothetical protein
VHQRQVRLVPLAGKVREELPDLRRGRQRRAGLLPARDARDAPGG